LQGGSASVDKLHDKARRAIESGETAKAIDYSLKRWPAFTHFLDDGRLCMSNNDRSESRYPVAFTGRVRSNVVPARPIARL
jgi:Transposase IS66 family